MTITDEMLMAYVDGELDANARAAVEQALQADAALRERLARHRALRSALRAAYDPVLAEPVPERLLAAARGQSGAGGAPPEKVIPLQRARRFGARGFSGREWGAMAATLIFGALLGALALHSLEISPVSERSGRLIAHGALASALSTQLASRQSPDAPVAIGLSFVSNSGAYCRTFTLRDRHALAGLACRDKEAWQIEVLTQEQAASRSTGTYRQAASPIPQVVLDFANAHMSGEPLDGRQEAQALARDWRQP